MPIRKYKYIYVYPIDFEGYHTAHSFLLLLFTFCIFVVTNTKVFSLWSIWNSHNTKHRNILSGCAGAMMSTTVKVLVTWDSSGWKYSVSSTIYQKVKLVMYSHQINKFSIHMSQALNLHYLVILIFASPSKV